MSSGDGSRASEGSGETGAHGEPDEYGGVLSISWSAAAVEVAPE